MKIYFSCTNKSAKNIVQQNYNSGVHFFHNPVSAAKIHFHCVTEFVEKISTESRFRYISEG